LAGLYVQESGLFVFLNNNCPVHNWHVIVTSQMLVT